MKKIVFVLVMVLVSTVCYAQSDRSKQLMEEYKNAILLKMETEAALERAKETVNVISGKLQERIMADKETKGEGDEHTD